MMSKSITASDGTVINIMADGSSVIGENHVRERKSNFNDNLADQFNINAADLLDGIESDIRSRTEMVETYIKGIDLLGLKIKDRSGSPQRKNISTVCHPVLLESIVKFQSTTRAELLPSAGPVKVMVEGNETEELNELATLLEQDMNYYLTDIATEYYPDTDRGLFRLGFGGTIFKKVYNCPIRKRPVSECVYLPDLIVSEEATDLENAIRVTHQILMSPNDVKRMVAAGVWMDNNIQAPSMIVDPMARKIASIEGVNKSAARPQDMQHTIYECYCELDIEDELPRPYRVTIDKDSRQVLECRRLWKEGAKDFKKKLPVVMYGLSPGMGFLTYGYLHLLGNQTKALTAIWRLLIDAGMFSCFPGGVKVKGTRQSTNEINPGPGEWPEIDTGPMDDIRKALMPLPYKEPSAVLMQFSEVISQDAQRMAGAIEMDVGEGRANVPVGTVMAMIEQQTQVMAAVHKRLHTSQAREFKLLKELFAEDPESLWKYNPRPGKQWTAAEFENLALIPASDPNIPAQVHRIMQATALKQLETQSPGRFNGMEIDKRILKMMGVGDPEALMNQNPQGPPPDPKAMAAMAAAQAKQTQVQNEIQQQQREAAQGVVDAHLRMQEIQNEAEQREQDRISREKVASMHVEAAKMKLEEEKAQNLREHHLDILRDAGSHALDLHQAAHSNLMDKHNILLEHKKLKEQKDAQARKKPSK